LQDVCDWVGPETKTFVCWLWRGRNGRGAGVGGVVADPLGKVATGLPIHFREPAADVDFVFVLCNTAYRIIESAVAETTPAYTVPYRNVAHGKTIAHTSEDTIQKKFAIVHCHTTREMPRITNTAANIFPLLTVPAHNLVAHITINLTEIATDIQLVLVYSPIPNIGLASLKPAAHGMPIGPIVTKDIGHPFAIHKNIKIARSIKFVLIKKDMVHPRGFCQKTAPWEIQTRPVRSVPISYRITGIPVNRAEKSACV
jgi:hypothetical protein